MDEAEVDDDAEDDDEDLGEDGFKELITNNHNEDNEEGEDHSHRRRLELLMDIQEEDKIEEYYR